jgi:hypothetical protein
MIFPTLMIKLHFFFLIFEKELGFSFHQHDAMLSYLVFVDHLGYAFNQHFSVKYLVC